MGLHKPLVGIMGDSVGLMGAHTLLLDGDGYSVGISACMHAGVHMFYAPNLCTNRACELLILQVFHTLADLHILYCSVNIRVLSVGT